MANPIDFIVKNGLQVSTNLVVGTYSVNANVTPISNGAIISGNVGIGTSIPIPGAMLTVAGNIFVTTGGSVGVGTAIVSSGNAVAIYGGNLFVAGNLTISNTATQLGGIQFADGTFQRSASIIPNPNAANTSNVNITTVSTDAVFYPTFVSAITGNLALYTNAGISVNPATGSLNVGGNLIVSGNLVVDNTYINNIFLSTTDTVIISNSNATTSSTSGALQVLGGGGFGGNLYVAGSSWINNLSVFSSNASTSSKTGALVVAGGAGIGGNLWVNNSINSSNLYASTNFQLGANLTTGTVVWNPTAANPWFGMYNNANSLYYGISSTLPSPSGTSTLGGYFKGLGVGGSTNSSGNPIFGVLTSTQSGQGIGSVAFTVYDTNKIQTFYNTIDDGAGNMVTAGYARHGNLSLISTTVSTSATTGALVVAGGAGIAGNLVVGSNLIVQNNANVTASYGSQMAPAIVGGNWTLGTGWSITSGQLIKVAGVASTATPIGTFTVVPGVTYQVIINVVASNVGNRGLVYSLGGVTGTTLFAGTVIDYITAVTSAILIFNDGGTGESITMSSISVISLTPNTGSLTVDGALTVRSTTSFANPVILGYNPQSAPGVPLEIMNSGNNEGIRIYRASNNIQYMALNEADGSVHQMLLVGQKQMSFVNQTTTGNQFVFYVNSTSAALNIDTAGNIYIYSSTATTSATSGALQVSGGVGIVGNLYVAGASWHNNLAVTSSIASTSTATGALTVAGGAGISSNLNVGGSMSTLAGNVGIGTTGATQVNPFEVWANNNLYFRVNTIVGAYSNSYIFARAGSASGPPQFGANSGNFMQIVANPYIQLGTGGGAMTATFNTNNSYVNQFVVSGGIANSNAVVVSTTGSDATVSLAIMPQGGANVGIGSSSPIYKLDVAGDIRTTGNIFAANTVGIGTTVMTSGYVLTVNGGIAATTKSFVIPHPTKPNMSLRYASLEGPENGVYLRGKLEGSNIIELPEYWSKLVDVDSITVHLTPVGKYQKLYVAKVTNTRIEIAVDSLFITPAISTFYTVYAERADVPKLLVEV